MQLCHANTATTCASGRAALQCKQRSRLLPTLLLLSAAHAPSILIQCFERTSSLFKLTTGKHPTLYICRGSQMDRIFNENDILRNHLMQHYPLHISSCKIHYRRVEIFQICTSGHQSIYLEYPEICDVAHRQPCGYGDKMSTYNRQTAA